MALIEWRDEFRVGVPAIDREHQELIALVNRAHDRMDAPADLLTPATLWPLVALAAVLLAARAVRRRRARAGRER